MWRVLPDPVATRGNAVGTPPSAARGRAPIDHDGAIARRPGWAFRSFGALAALIALWFAMAFLGGLPGGAVEWLALAMLGAFAYSLGVMLAAATAFLVTRALRL
ncbi:MAG: hypothetical protein ACOCYW_02695 [Roseicyclus sp.]